MVDTPASVDPIIQPATPIAIPCPACDGGGRGVFYALPRIPVQSNIMFETPAEACAIEHGALRLAVCDRCGYVGNVDFDPATQELSSRYEVSQGFSPTFSGFLGRMAQDLIDRYDIRGKRVVEIGCGAGEFIGAICALGDNRGIGIDPATDPARLPEGLGDRLTLMSERWDPDRHRSLDADVVCCRHTLEHIETPLAFLRDVRAGIGDDTLVIFEVPDATRILDEGAFWDVYYEHAGYWLPSAVHRVFAAAGFAVETVDRVFGDQYLLVVARPCASDQPSLPATDDDAASLVATFCERSRANIADWSTRIGAVTRSGGSTVLWGSGSKAVGFLSACGGVDGITHIVDINPHRDGRRSPGTGHEIILPVRLPDVRPELVIIMNPAYASEITDSIAAMGLSPDIRTVLSS